MSDDPPSAFDVQADVRRPWRRYLDALAPLRPALHRYCCRLTGSVWDGEDLMQDALLRVFGLLGKIDADLTNPKAYFIRTATHLWIDEQRRLARHAAWRAHQSDVGEAPEPADRATELSEAAGALLQRLAPRERAAIVMREVLGLSAKESAALLQTTEGAVKAALHRGRERLQGEPSADAGRDAPPPELVERFLDALSAKRSDDAAGDLFEGPRGRTRRRRTLRHFRGEQDVLRARAHGISEAIRSARTRDGLRHGSALAQLRLSRRAHRARFPYPRRNGRSQRNPPPRRRGRQDRADTLLLLFARIRWPRWARPSGCRRTADPIAVRIRRAERIGRSPHAIASRAIRTGSRAVLSNRKVTAIATNASPAVMPLQKP